MGTRLTTNAADTSVQEQAALPFGVALDAEMSGAATSRRFTSYERSGSTGLDYAVNRHYDSMQGRFTQVDPIGMRASNLSDPQSLNLYAYCGNDPINRVDPSGLFWGKLFKWLSKALKWIAIAVMVAVAVISVISMIAGPAALQIFLSTTTLGKILGFIAGIPKAIGDFIVGVGRSIAGVFGFAAEGVSARIAVLIGNGVLIAGILRAGAVSNYLDEKRKKGLTVSPHQLADALRRIDDKYQKCLKDVRDILEETLGPLDQEQFRLAVQQGIGMVVGLAEPPFGPLIGALAPLDIDLLSGDHNIRQNKRRTALRQAATATANCNQGRENSLRSLGIRPINVLGPVSWPGSQLSLPPIPIKIPGR